MKNRSALRVSFVDIGALIDQDVHNVLVPPICGCLQWVAVKSMLNIYISILVKQNLNY